MEGKEKEGKREGNPVSSSFFRITYAADWLVD